MERLPAGDGTHLHDHVNTILLLFSSFLIPFIIIIIIILSNDTKGKKHYGNMSLHKIQIHTKILKCIKRCMILRLSPIDTKIKNNNMNLRYIYLMMDTFDSGPIS